MIDGIQPTGVNLFQWMIFCQFPLLPAFQIANLPTRSVEPILGSIAAAVFCAFGVGGQEPAPTDGTLLGSVPHAQSFIQVRTKHSHKCYIEHPFNQRRHRGAGTNHWHILQSGVGHGHPAITFPEILHCREYFSEQLRIAFWSSFTIRDIKFFCKWEHCVLIRSQRVTQVRQNWQHPQQPQSLFVSGICQIGQRSIPNSIIIRIGVS